MTRAAKLAENLLFSLDVLLIFFLVAEQWVCPPQWLQPIGRLHPLLIHFPIVIILAALALYFYDAVKGVPNPVTRPLLLAGTVAAAFAASAGFFLSKEGGYDSELLALHKWTGIGVTLCGTVLYYLMDSKFSQNILSRILAVIGLILLVSAGHLGGSLTHGEDFLLGWLKTSDTAKVNDSTVFAAAITPLLENKCFGCHNDRKAKGRLVLTSFESMKKGGKTGALWKLGDPGNSLILQRLKLPLDHKKHMPPKDKSQPDSLEISMIQKWIATGADPKATIEEQNDTLKQMAIEISWRYATQTSSLYHFAFAPKEKIEKLNNPYRTVSQLANNEPALYADFFVRNAFSKESLDELEEVKEQIIAINLSKMPITDADLGSLFRFVNLENLNLNNTDITGPGISGLKQLPRLALLSLAGTGVSPESVSSLAESRSLREVFLWNTSITSNDLARLAQKYPQVEWHGGFEPDEKEKLQLSAPLLQNENQVLEPEETIVMKATLPGTTIRYTLDGGDPDSIRSPAFDGQIAVGAYSLVRAKAFKEGWASSDVTDFVFFRKGIHPSRAILTFPGNKKYPGIGAETLIDGVNGFPEFVQGPAWIAFREKPMEAYFYFDEQAPVLQSLTISFSKNVGSMTMPPAEVEVWGGPDKDHLRLLNRVVPRQPTEYGKRRIEGTFVPLPGTSFACYKLIAKPLSKLPAFRKAKKTDKGWLMVDEVFFN